MKPPALRVNTAIRSRSITTVKGSKTGLVNHRPFLFAAMATMRLCFHYRSLFFLFLGTLNWRVVCGFGFVDYILLDEAVDVLQVITSNVGRVCTTEFPQVIRVGLR